MKLFLTFIALSLAGFSYYFLGHQSDDSIAHQTQVESTKDIEKKEEETSQSSQEDGKTPIEIDDPSATTQETSRWSDLGSQEEQLMEAAWNGDQVTLEVLFKNGLPIDTQNEAGLTALHQALNNDHFILANWLIEQGANPNLVTKTGITPIALAAVSDEAELTERMILSGADVNQPLHRGGFTLLMNAALEGLTATLKVLIKHKADLNRQDDLGKTALIYAADMGQEEIVQVLLKAGADRSLKTLEGKTAYDFALDRQLSGLAELLRP